MNKYAITFLLLLDCFEIFLCGIEVLKFILYAMILSLLQKVCYINICTFAYICKNGYFIKNY